MNPLTKGEHKNGNRVISDWCRTLDGCICGIRLQGSWHGKNQQKTCVSDWIVFRRISGTDAVSRLGAGNPLSEIHYFGRSLDRLFLLLFIGGKMVIEAVRDKDVQEIGAKDLPLDHKEMLLLAVATSIDALAVGITFAFLNVSIMEACLIIGCTTFVLSVIGVVVGNFFGTRYKRKAEIAGGVILILIGLKILLEHLGMIAF